VQLIFEYLVKGDVATAAVDDATNALDQAKAGLAEETAGLKAATDQAGTPGDQNAAVRAALGQLTQAKINLSYATVTAPADGWVANIGSRPGQVVGAGQALFSLVEDGEWWVDGNFKETDLLRIRPGQPVTVAIDMYPGTNVMGKIASIGAGSGAAFSLLAPQNATGNWVKVTQRFHVVSNWILSKAARCNFGLGLVSQQLSTPLVWKPIRWPLLIPIRPWPQSNGPSFWRWF
jgi:membrane fusion protein, multidrug efflux system